MTELETKIFEFIECRYKLKFLGKVEVIHETGDHCLRLTLNNYMIPMQICFQCETEDEFFEFITKELTKRNLSRVGYFKLKLEHGKN